MDAIPYTRLRSNLASEMDRVCADLAPAHGAGALSAALLSPSPAMRSSFAKRRPPTTYEPTER